MNDATYCRERAAQARRLAETMHQRDVCETLREMAQDYEDIAADLENGAVELRHPELMPQRRRQGGELRANRPIWHLGGQALERP
jgi:hypothetical protein